MHLNGVQIICPMRLDPFSPDLHFALGNALVLPSWGALAVSTPTRRWTPARWRLTGVVVPLLLAPAHAALFPVHRGRGGHGSLAAVRQLFDRPGRLAGGWLHDLAFDRFVGAGIARRAAVLGLHHAGVVPCLGLTFLFGPLGLLAFALGVAAGLARGGHQPPAGAGRGAGAAGCAPRGHRHVGGRGRVDAAVALGLRGGVTKFRPGARATIRAPAR